MPKNSTRADDIMLNERAELNYFLGNPPSWMLRNGIIMVALFLGLLLGLSYLIKYPDVVACRVVLITENPPIRVFAQATGRISELCIKENDPVEAGQILAVFENTADWHDVLWLETQLQAPNPQRGLLYSGKPPLGVGGLQGIYSTFIQNAKDYAYFIDKNGVATKIDHLNHQIEGLHALNQNLLKQKDIQAKEYALTEHDVNRQKQLHTEGVISDMDFEKFQ